MVQTTSLDWPITDYPY
jgi:hypothetical protein